MVALVGKVCSYQGTSSHCEDNSDPNNGMPRGGVTFADAWSNMTIETFSPQPGVKVQ